ncbi:MAG: exosortase [Planctomycetes bacterium]|nr:exosortase [Planctomycetota bacterium]
MIALTTPRSWARNGWSPWHIVAAIFMVTLGVLLTFNAWADIFNIAAKDEEASHIFLVPIIAGWLVWVRRERLRFCYPTGTLIGPVFVVIGWATTYYGYYHAIQAAWHFGAVLVVVGCLLSVIGKDVFMRFLPAFAVLVFLVPVPGSIRLGIAIPLQGILAHITQTIFDVMGVDVERAGNMLTINGQEVAIAEACNGLRMVFALMLVSFAFAFGTPLRTFVRTLIIAASPVSALVCNIIRMVPTVWLYGLSGRKLAGFDATAIANHFHDYAGWVMLIAAFLLLMSIIKVLQWALIPVTPYMLAYD